MKRQPIERYGFGQRLPTRTDRSVRALTVVAALTVLALLWCMPW